MHGRRKRIYINKIYIMHLKPLLFFFFFFFNDPPPPEIYPLPLHAALPISLVRDGVIKSGPNDFSKLPFCPSRQRDFSEPLLNGDRLDIGEAVRPPPRKTPIV